MNSILISLDPYAAALQAVLYIIWPFLVLMVLIYFVYTWRKHLRGRSSVDALVDHLKTGGITLKLLQETIQRFTGIRLH
jgi:hypothetical protein